MVKAILASDIGITPSDDGIVIRLIFPQLTEEHRKELTKQIQKMGEEARVAIRNVRREANDEIKKQKKDGEMTEDEQKASEKSVQDLTDKSAAFALSIKSWGTCADNGTANHSNPPNNTFLITIFILLFVLLFSKLPKLQSSIIRL